VLGRGNEDLARRAADAAVRLPDALAPLARIAYNYRWCWYPGGKDVFAAIDERRWSLCGENPVRSLEEAFTAADDGRTGAPVSFSIRCGSPARSRLEMSGGRVETMISSWRLGSHASMIATRGSG
jgi:Protein of unknown function (DUF3417)